MDFLKSTLIGTLTVPEGHLPTVSVSHSHPHPTGHPMPPPHHGHGHGGWHPHVEHATESGRKALMVITVVFGVASIITFLLSRRVEKKLRLFHHITGVIIVTAFLSYLAMSTGIGIAYVPSYKDEGEKLIRQVYYARYIDWAITTPLLLLDLALLAGLPLTTTVIALAADEAMIITGLIAGLSKQGERERWVWYTVSCAFFLYVLFVLLVSGLKSAKLQSNKVQSVYAVTMPLTVVLWTMYPIVFGVTEGKGIISVDSEIIWYGILDILAKVGFGMYLLIAHSHTEGDSVVIPESWTEPRNGGGYGSISLTE